MDQVVQPHMLPFLPLLEDLLFHQDNAPPHIAGHACLGHMGRRIRNSLHAPQVMQRIEHELKIVWDAVLQGEIDLLLE